MNVTWGMARTLGTDFIKNNGIGIVELIKNGYDADATVVNIDLSQAFEHKLDDCQLLISDDGHGMSKKDFTDKFLTAFWSYNTTPAGRHSPKGRRRTGGKGVGRFALQRLGKKFTLVSKKEDCNVMHIEFDWDEYSDKTPVGEVPFLVGEGHEKYSHYFTEGQTGTVILIEGFRQPMKGKKQTTNLQTVHKYVRTMLNPFNDDSDFQVNLLGLPKRISRWMDFDLGDRIEEAAQGIFHARLSSDVQHVEYEFTDNHPWSETKGERIESRWSTHDLLGGEDEIKIKGIEIWINLLLRGKGKKGELAIQKLKLYDKAGQVTKEDLDEICGFRLYRDDVRVFPYGEVKGAEGGDWLNLNRQWTKRGDSVFRQHQMVAAASINGSLNPNIKDQANRDGLHDGPEKDQLILLLQNIVKRLRTESQLCGNWPSKKPKEMVPPSIKYGISHSYQVGQDVWINPTVTGHGIPSKYSLKGKLPEGLKFNNISGVISGEARTLTEETVDLFIVALNKHGESDPFALYLEVKEREEQVDFHERCRSCGAIAVPKSKVCKECGFDNKQQVIAVEVCEECGQDKENCVCGKAPVVLPNVWSTKVIDVATNLNRAGSSDDDDVIKLALETARDDIDEILSEIDD